MNISEITQYESFSKKDADHYFKCKVDEVLTSRAVHHPFLEWYAHNTLTKNQERILFSECYYWFKDLPFYIASMSTITSDQDILREIMLNVSDEICGEKTHAELYLEFIESIGIEIHEVESYVPSDETILLNTGMKKLYGNHPIEKALGALFFDEFMSAIMVDKVSKGLLNQGYDEVSIHFWILHIEVEKNHGSSVKKAFYPYANDLQKRNIFENGFYELMDLVEKFWDQIDRKIRY